MVAVEKLAESLLEDALNLHVSDIHFVPRTFDVLVQFRVDHDLVVKDTLQKDVYNRLLSHFKFLAEMDIGEHRKPQNGAMAFEINQTTLSLRLSTLPTANEESLVIRILPTESSYPIEYLSLFQNSTRKLLSMLNHSHGLIIFTGPTGSGKTTTLYSILHASKRLFNRNIITLEDPIEKKSDEVLQVQVNEKAGISYASGLKAILRHDPDIIMVGEIRDAETAEIAIRAALTGHLVLTTMHTRDAIGAIYRLLEFNITIQEIEQTMIAVVAQRLVELKCPYCVGECSFYCKKMREVRRTGVYELLYGKALTQVIREARGEKTSYRYTKLKDVIKKGIALGYLENKEFYKWVYENE